jgi:hypothetical protein
VDVSEHRSFRWLVHRRLAHIAVLVAPCSDASPVPARAHTAQASQTRHRGSAPPGSRQPSRPAAARLPVILSPGRFASSGARIDDPHCRGRAASEEPTSVVLTPEPPNPPSPLITMSPFEIANLFSVSGRDVLVTGGGSGIGQSAAIACASPPVGPRLSLPSRPLALTQCPDLLRCQQRRPRGHHRSSRGGPP